MPFSPVTIPSSYWSVASSTLMNTEVKVKVKVAAAAPTHRVLRQSTAAVSSSYRSYIPASSQL